MSFEVRWTATALARMEVLCDFIAQRDPAAAVRVIDDLFDRVAVLADQPFIGHVVPKLDDAAFRQMNFDRYRVTYFVEEQLQRVDVLTVQHSRELPLSPQELEELVHDE